MRRMETTLTQKGQVTVRLPIRRALGLERGDRIVFEIEDGRAILRRSPETILAGFGAVAPRKRPEDFRALRDEFERGVAAEGGTEDRGERLDEDDARRSRGGRVDEACSLDLQARGGHRARELEERGGGINEADARAPSRDASRAAYELSLITT